LDGDIMQLIGSPRIADFDLVFSDRSALYIAGRFARFCFRLNNDCRLLHLIIMIYFHSPSIDKRQGESTKIVFSFLNRSREGLEGFLSESGLQGAHEIMHFILFLLLT
jgi:hypothetical protein